MTTDKRTPIPELVKATEDLLKVTWGWTKDCEYIAEAVKSYDRSQEVIAELSKAIEWVIANHTFPSTGDSCYKILKDALAKATALQEKGEK